MKSEMVVHSVKWSAATEFFSKIMTPISNMILARLLAPEVFGIVATLSIVTTLAETFADMGVQKFLVQHEFVNEKELNEYANTSFWTVAFMAVIIVALIGRFSEQLATFAGSSGYGNEMFVMSWQLLLVSYSGIQVSLFRREFRFKELMPIRLVNSLVYLIVTVIVAMMMKNCWALILGSLAREVMGAILLTRKSFWRPYLYFSFTQLKNMLYMSLWMQLETLLVWVTSNVDVFILARGLSDHSLGIYKQGVAAIRPYTNLIFSMAAPVLFSTLSRVSGQKGECDRYLLNFQKFTAYIVLPFGISILVFRDLVTYILLGGQWEEAALLLGIIGLSSAVSVIVCQYNSVYYRAVGRPGMSLLVQGIYGGILICGCLYYRQGSFERLCIFRGIVELLHSVISGIVMRVGFGIKIRFFFANIWQSIVITSIILVLGTVLVSINENMVWQFTSAFIAIIAACLVGYILPGVKKDLQQLVEMYSKGV